MTEEVVDFDVARLKMKKWRDDIERNSEEIVEYGECLIAEYANKLGDELWVLYEQVCLAALDCCRIDLAEECLIALHKQFPRSNRVNKLQGMYHEARRDYEKAESLYNTMLKDDPSNLIIRKRLIAMKKSQNKYEETIEELNLYLRDYMADQEAWMELSELYIHQQEFSKAAFCMEEMILSHPHNHLYHQRYAAIQFTIGTPDSMEKATKYYAQALKLDPSNMRAMYGLFLSSSNTAQAKSASNTKKKSISLSQWTANQIGDMYDTEVNGNAKRTMADMFENLQIALPSSIPE